MAQQYDMPLKELEKYKPHLTRHSDFEDFWEKSLKKLESISREYSLIPYDYPVKGVEVYQISYSGFENANIDGWLAIPKGVKNCPGIVMFHGYNWAFDGNLHNVVDFALKGYATMHVLVRGQQGKSVDNIISMSGFTAGWITKGILDPEEYYYRAVYLDGVRAVEVLASLDFVDNTKIGVVGGSQGGAIALAVAALSNIPKVTAVEYPFLSNFERAIEVVPKGPYLEIIDYFRRNSNVEIEEKAKNTLSYFDIMNLSPLIKCHTWMCVGLVDEITPPSTVFATYNHLECSKEISVFKYFGHEYIPGAVEPKLKCLMNILQM
ncbi:UNVERIFIED_CONTAM: cephalosporin-C deacetylase [Acetivibrio alkalicellulosi]